MYSNQLYTNPLHATLAPFLWDALRHARQCLLLKAANKVYPDKDKLRITKAGKPESLQRHTTEADRRKWASFHALRRLDSEQDPLVSTRLLESARGTGQEYAGNCGEYTALAYCYLVTRSFEVSARAGRSLRIIYASIPDPGDHEFVIIDPVHPFRPLPCFIRELHSDAMILDPWANFVCSAHDCSVQWRQKMIKWSHRGLRIERNSGLIDPRCLANMIDAQRAEERGAHEVMFGQRRS